MMETYLVGGAVRDELLGYPFEEKDWVVVGGTAEQLLQQGYRQVGKDFPVFLHPETREEYALARTERKRGHGYHGFDCNSEPSVTLEEDLSRRDLTINAMARSVDGALIDPFHGQQDLEQKLLRHVSPAFVEDPLRVLRVARFKARYQHLGFELAAETLEMMRDISRSGELQYLPVERTWTETERALGETTPRAYFETLAQCDALPVLLAGLSLPPMQLAALDRASQASEDTAIRFAALLAASSESQVAECLRALKPPGRHRDLARLCSEQFDNYRNIEQADAQAVLKLLSQVDALRRPDRFEDFLCACETATDMHTPTRYLQRAQQACLAIQASEFAAAGFKGAEIGEKLTAARLAALETL